MYSFLWVFSSKMKILNLARKYAEILNGDVYHKNMVFIYYLLFMAYTLVNRKIELLFQIPDL